MTARTLPSSQVAEYSVLGAVLLRPDVFDELPTVGEDFLNPRNRLVWDAMVALREKRRAIDPTTLEAELDGGGHLSAVGGQAYLGKLALAVPTASNVEHYVAILRERRLARDLIQTCSEIVGKAYQSEDGSDEILTEAMGALGRLEIGLPDTGTNIGQVVRDRFTELGKVAEAKARGESGLTGIPTGIEALDKILCGLKFGRVTIIAARPAMGKSALALGVSRHAAENGFPPHVFSLEDTRDAYADRSLAQVSGMSAEEIAACNYSRENITRLSIAAQHYWSLRGRWMVDDRSGLSAEEIIRAVRRRRRDNGTRLVVVDYLQLLRPPKGAKGPYESVTGNINLLADAAKNDGLAYVVLCQLSRKLEEREDKRPRMADLRDAGPIEERSKCIVGIYRGAYYGEASPKLDKDASGAMPTAEQWERRCELIILKNSNGVTGRVWTRWDGPTLTIS